MRITKYTHSCVRLQAPGGTVVVDPGIWSEPRALLGADAVLLTHEHADHVDRLRLRGTGVPVYAPAGARIEALEYTGVAPGEEFEVAGLRVRAFGGRHATVYGGEPDCANLGYLVDGLYHPGDSLSVPGQPVETLLVPMQGSWLKTAEAIEFIRAVPAERVFGIHEGQLNERGRESINGWFAEAAGDRYRFLPPGTTA